METLVVGHEKVVKVLIFATMNNLEILVTILESNVFSNNNTIIIKMVNNAVAPTIPNIFMILTQYV